MIQFNLLPDVKLEYVKAQRIKKTVISAALISAASSFLIFLLLFAAVNVVQKKNIADLNTDIKRYSSELKDTPDLGKILTIQSQLGVLPSLHAGKPAVNRTFTFIQQFTPADVTLADVTTDYEQNTITITGQSKTLDKVNAFVDTLKFTTYTDSSQSSQPAFSNVVLSQFTRNALLTTYTITLSYAPAIFDNAEKSVLLKIPNGVSTRSVVEQPTDIFEKPAVGPNVN